MNKLLESAERLIDAMTGYAHLNDGHLEPIAKAIIQELNKERDKPNITADEILEAMLKIGYAHIDDGHPEILAKAMAKELNERSSNGGK